MMKKFRFDNRKWCQLLELAGAGCSSRDNLGSTATLYPDIVECIETIIVDVQEPALGFDDNRTDCNIRQARMALELPGKISYQIERGFNIAWQIFASGIDGFDPYSASSPRPVGAKQSMRLTN